MDAPLSVWYCDTCGEAIRNPADGYVIWDSKHAEGSDVDRFAFHIVHKTKDHRPKCDNGSQNSSKALKELLGPEGLSYLMSFISAGPLIIDRIEDPAPLHLHSPGDFADLVRRLHVPYYEEARLRFRNPDLLEMVGDWNECSPYTPRELERFICQFPLAD